MIANHIFQHLQIITCWPNSRIVVNCRKRIYQNMFKKKHHSYFNIHDDLFEREVLGDTTNFISIYYLEYGEDDG